MFLASAFLVSCGKDKEEPKEVAANTGDFQYEVEQFADIKVLRYQVPGWEKLTLKEQKLVYYLTQAGMAGRDIHWDQNYKHNLKIRKALESIYENYKGDKASEDWKNFEIYLKRVWFSNGIHHHYSSDKIKPAFTKEYFQKLLSETKTTLAPEIVEILFNNQDAKKVNLDESKGLLAGSAVNFYDKGITDKEAEEYYKTKKSPDAKRPYSFGLNSKLVRNASGQIEEKVWKSGGMYGPAIDKIIYWLEKAQGVAENKKQGDAIGLLIKYYKTGDLKTWDDYNIAWTEATEGNIDYINGFIEVYNDPLGYRGSYESVVQIKDFDMSKKMEVISSNAQWFEDNSTLMPEHKKKNVVGVSYKVVVVAGESGDSSPSTPIGVNLPNADWIRAEHGSKSVSLGNIVDAYNHAGGSDRLKEFANDKEERHKKARHYRAFAGLAHPASGSQNHLHAARLGIAAAALRGFGLLQLHLLFGHTQGLQGVAHGQRALLGQLGVHGRVARGVMEARHHRGLAAVHHALDHVAQRFVGARGQLGLAGGEEELHHTALHHHAGGVLGDHDHHAGRGCLSRRGHGGGRRLGGVGNATLVDHHAHDGGDHQRDQRKEEPECEALLAVVVGAVEGHVENSRE